MKLLIFIIFYCFRIRTRGRLNLTIGRLICRKYRDHTGTTNSADNVLPVFHEKICNSAKGHF